MKYIKNPIEAYIVYEEMKNWQPTFKISTLISIIKEFINLRSDEFTPMDFNHLFEDKMHPDEYSYGNLEVLRGLKILKRISETKRIYKLSPLGELFKNSNNNIMRSMLYEALNYLRSTKIIIGFLRSKGSANIKEVIDELGKEMIYYNKKLIRKNKPTPFNEARTRAYLNLLSEFKIINKDLITNKYSF